MKMPPLPKRGDRGWLAIVLVTLLATGIALLGANSLFHLASDLARDFGIALIISAVTGGTVEFNLRTQLARDVVEAALGYVFPEEFRAEVRQIISYKFFCEKHRMRIKVEFVDAQRDCVRVIVDVERRLKNITANKEPLQGYTHIDEYRFDQESSKILACSACLEGEAAVSFTEAVKDEATVQAKTNEVYVQPKGYGILSATSVEIRRANDHVSFVYLSPTKDPEAIVELPSELDCGFNFGSPHTKTEETKSAHDNSRRYSMTGTYFPHQHMRLRFWKKPQEPKAAGT